MGKYIPTVIHKTESGERAFDIYSMLLSKRIVFINGAIESSMADDIIAQLLYLDGVNNDDIYLYIDSPGGCVLSGLKIINIMNHIKSDVSTVVTGLAASMGFALTTAGAKGKRFALPNAHLMAHRVSSGAGGNIQDMEVRFEFTKRLDKQLYEMISKNIGMPIDKYLKAVERDLWLTPEESLAFGKKGVIDNVLQQHSFATK